MQIYVVRLTDYRELVGIYAASSLADLADLVDECTDPHECEYIKIGRGGLYWPTKVAPTIPVAGKADVEDDLIKLGSAALTDDWMNVLWSDERWRPVPHSPVCDAINSMQSAMRRIAESVGYTTKEEHSQPRTGGNVVRFRGRKAKAEEERL